MDLAERVRAHSWYHVMELAPGVVTDGIFDLRHQMHHYQVPDDLTGLRVLDVGTMNGYWAFELERRGAAEVVSLDVDDDRDLDWTPRRRAELDSSRPSHEGLWLGHGRAAFELAREALDSKVERVVSPLYDATPERFGKFDLIFCGSVLTHVRDQLLALERLAGLCRGRMILAEQFDALGRFVPWPSLRVKAHEGYAQVFYVPSEKAWTKLIWTAGFEDVQRRARFKLQSTAGWTVPHLVFTARISDEI